VKAVAACQRTMRACGLLQALCDILMASGVPADVLTETISTVAEVIRGNASNQEFLAGVMAPSIPPRYTLDTCQAQFIFYHTYIFGIIKNDLQITYKYIIGQLLLFY